MYKSTKSLLLVAMMAVSGFAAAQPAPANDVKSGTQGGSGPSAAEKAKPGSMPESRAAVKSEATPMKSGVDGGKGPVANSTKMTAAERRAAKENKGKRTPASKADTKKDGKSAL